MHLSQHPGIIDYGGTYLSKVVHTFLKSPITITWDGPLEIGSANSLYNLSPFAGKLVGLLYIHTSMTLVLSLKFNWINILSFKQGLF